MVDKHPMYSVKQIWLSSLVSKTRKIRSIKAESWNNIAFWNCLKKERERISMSCDLPNNGTYFLFMNSLFAFIFLKCTHNARTSFAVKVVDWVKALTSASLSRHCVVYEFPILIKFSTNWNSTFTMYDERNVTEIISINKERWNEGRKLVLKC